MKNFLKYRDYEIDKQPNEWGFYEATPNDCDGVMVYAKSIDKLKEEINEKLDQ